MSPGTHAPERITWMIELLAVAPSDELLEIGCGPGHAFQLVCARLADGTITAIDRSATMVARARERNQASVDAGRARIEHADLTTLDLGQRRFDSVFAVNVNAFWTAPAPSLASVRRVLRPGGALFLVYEPPTASRLQALRDSLPRTLGHHAFGVEDVQVRTFRASQGLCVVGRPGAAPDHAG